MRKEILALVFLLLAPLIVHGQSIGSYTIGSVVPFYANAHSTTAACTDADAAPTYRVYNGTTATPVASGSMALQDSANTCGFYSGSVTLTAGTYAIGTYAIYIEGIVGGVTGTTSRWFQVVSSPALADTHEIRRATAQANGGSLTSIKLDASASAVSNFYSRSGTIVMIISGSGAGQFRHIVAYDGSTKIATVDNPWFTAPDATSVFVLMPR